MTVRNVIFDMDGVLVDTEPLYFRVNQGLFRDLGISVSSEEQKSFVGLAADKVWSYLARQHSLQQSLLALIQFEKEAVYRSLQLLDSLPPITGIPNLLNFLRAKKIPLAVASSSYRKIVELILQKSEIFHFFPVIVSGDEVIHGKPEPDIFLKTASLLKTQPEECLVIEDSFNGVTAAKRAGMICVGFQNLNSGKQNLDQSDLVICDFSEDSLGKIYSMLLEN